MLVRQLVVHRADTRVLPDDVRRHLVQRCLCVHIRMYMFHVHRRTEYICTGDMRQGGSDGSDCQIREQLRQLGPRWPHDDLYTQETPYLYACALVCREHLQCHLLCTC